MIVDGCAFVRRARKFLKELQDGNYPNASTLAQLCKCSRNTAQRVIYRLRDEYLIPFDYDPSKKGYYLKDPSYTLPAFLPPGRDELTALLLATDLVRSIDAQDLIDRLGDLWTQFATANSMVAVELNPLSEVFSSDSTVIAHIADSGVLKYVEAASVGESVRMVYKSPWRHKEPKTYEGKIERVHFSDGSLYLLFHEVEGHKRVLNAAFIKSFEILDHDLKCVESDSPDIIGSENWCEGFGIWAGEEIYDLEIKIRPPAAEYYASQRWHPDQVDSWDGEILVRSLPSMLSPEIVRRILSLGSYVVDIKPDKLKEMVSKEAQSMVANLS